MPKFRSKPKVVVADQWFQWMKEGEFEVYLRDGAMWVESIHGPVLVHDRDWLIWEPDGIHRYPCREDIFEANYECVG